MRTIRYVKTAMLAGAILATAGAVWCGSAVAQQSSNDINRIPFPQRDLTKSIPPPGPTSSTRSQPMPTHPIVPPKHRPRHTVLHCSPMPDHALRSCPVVALGVEDAPEPQPIAATPPPPTAETPTRAIIITHDMVEKLQSELLDAGNYSGPISGVFDFPTRNALMAWQRAHGKKATGSLNAATLEDFGIARQ